MKSTQDVFKTLIKDIIAPRMREIGFKGSGQNYYIPSDTHWSLLGFQKSMFSDSEDLRFTINLYVVTKDEWAMARSKRSYYPKKPTPTTSWGVGWHERIGFSMPEKTDYWWTLNSNTDLESLPNEVITVIEQIALPAMQDKMKGA